MDGKHGGFLRWDEAGGLHRRSVVAQRITHCGSRHRHATAAKQLLTASITAVATYLDADACNSAAGSSVGITTFRFPSGQQIADFRRHFRTALELAVPHWPGA